MQFIISVVIFLISNSRVTLVNGSNYRIVGGNPAGLGEFPYQASLRRSYNDHHFCGGTIISPIHILTAGHCLLYSWGGILSPDTVSVFTAQVTLGVSQSLVYGNASKIVIHENFSVDVMANDIGIIWLDQKLPLELHKLLNAVPLREHSINSGKCLVSGWGLPNHNSGSVSNILMAAEVTIINFPECRGLYDKGGITLSEGMLCAGHEKGDTDACQGDSGGPLVCNGLLTGVISTGSGCGDAAFPGIYTDVAKFLPWIKGQIQESIDATSPPKDLILKQQENQVEVNLTTITTGIIDEATAVVDFKKNLSDANILLHHGNNGRKLVPTLFVMVFIIIHVRIRNIY